jgi:general secretion pathway protein L
MADTLLLRLPPALDEHATWLVVDARGTPTGPPQSGPLTLAAARSAGRRLVVLVPGSEVLLAAPEVPAKAGAKLAQLVPFALEEQLADDIDELHFAVGRRVPGSFRVPVAVVARSRMDTWLGALREAGLPTPDVLAVDSELLPHDPGHSVALLEGDCVVVRAPTGLPMTLPAAALTEALVAVQSPADLAGGGVRGLILYAGAAEWHQSQAQVEALRERFDGSRINLLTGGPLALLAQNLPSATPINLLQGSYAPVGSKGLGWHAWRLAAVLLLGLLGLHMAGKAAALSLLHSHEHQLDTQIRDTFRTAMQQESGAGDARHLMEQRLALTRGINTGLLAALEAMVQARGTLPGTVQVSSLNYHNGLIDLKLTAPDAASLDRLSAALRSGGWQAQLQGGNHGPQGYEGRVQIRTGG